ncbi:hypothetical protein CUPS3778_09145 [Campylobacter upsaliensis]|uniref:hypothetical protein n=1 Tax=Campylobacter upsaliensis TaxID=28080 RepID=UPI00214A21E4|nr:hypothetical protein [Campylobacter upsaliensis]MCR2125190.1 hypothetical protein [Campylobacter upsaliensis]
MGLKPLRQKAELKRPRVAAGKVKQCQAGSRAEDLGGVKQKSAACAGQDQAEQGKFKPISPVKRFFLKAKS